MFFVKERTRRFLCRAGFVFFCVLPTIGVAGWAAAVRSSPYRATHEARLSQWLGMPATVESVSHPLHGVTRYQHLVLREPETAELLARAAQVDIAAHPQAWVVTATELELQSGGTAALRRLVEQRLRDPDGRRLPLVLTARQVRLGNSLAVLSDVQARVDADPSLSRAAVVFRLGEAPHPPTRVRWTRDRRASPPVWRFELNTGEAPLPCPLVGLLLGCANWLGSQSAFLGGLQAERIDGEGWQGEAVGRLTGIDLDRLVSERFPHRISGIAQLDLRRAEFRRSRLEEMDGTLVAGPGLIGESLLASAAASLGLIRTTRPAAPGSIVQYEQLAADFIIDATGLIIRGRAAGQDMPPGVVLYQRNEPDLPLLREPPGPSGSVVALIRALVPQSQVQVPATRETDWLMQVLPVPQVVPLLP